MADEVSIVSCVCWPLVCFLWRNAIQAICSFFKWVFFVVVIVEVIRIFHVAWILDTELLVQ